MGTNRLKAVIAGVVALLVVGGVGAAVVYFIGRDNEDPLAAAAKARMKPGTVAPAPAQNGVMQRYAYTGAPLKGVVKTPDGKPVAGADVIVQSLIRRMMIPLSGEAPGATGHAQSGADGHFEVTPTEQPGAIIVRCPQGIAFTSANELSASPNVVVQPWGRIDGNVRVGSRPASGARVELMMTIGDPRSGPANVTMTRTILMADPMGHFSLDQVPAGRVRIGVTPPGSQRPQRYQELEVQSGATASITIGGNGRPVIGKLVPAVESNMRQLTLMPRRTNPFAGRDLSKMSAVERLQAQREMTNSPEYKAWLSARRNSFNVNVGPDGSFRIDDVPAGKYSLQANYSFYETRQVARMPIVPERVASAQQEITVPDMPDGHSDDPLDLGEIQLKVANRLIVGKPVPELNGVDAAGKPVKLSDFRGKYLLFTITDVDNGRDWNETVRLGSIFDRFGNDPRLAMVVVHNGSDFGIARREAEQSGVRWQMIHLDKPPSDPLPEQYVNATLKIFLLDPEGNLLSRSLDPLGAYGMIDDILAQGMMKPASDVEVTVEQVSSSVAMGEGGYDKVPPPSANDAATDAVFTSVDGTPIRPANAPDRLHDGHMQADPDDPARSFFYETGTLEGRLKIELSRTMPIARINSYSWHKEARGPQVYELFGSDGAAPGFNASPTIGIDPTKCGWTHIASVDTRPKSGSFGGRYSVSISRPSGTLGNYHYLLFEIFPTETRDPYGHTFYGEIDVIEKK